MTNFPWSNLRHDLRTPVNAVIGYAELLMEQLERAGQAETGDVAGTGDGTAEAVGQESIPTDKALRSTDGLAELQEIEAVGRTLLHTITQVLPPDETLDWLTVQQRLRQEMRSPINAILGYCDLLLERNAPNMKPDVEIIQAATQQLRTLIGHLDQWSPTERSPMSSIEPTTKSTTELTMDSTPPSVTALTGLVPGSPNDAPDLPSDLAASPMTARPAVLSSAIDPSASKGHILVVDDNINNRSLLTQKSYYWIWT